MDCPTHKIKCPMKIHDFTVPYYQTIMYDNFFPAQKRKNNNMHDNTISTFILYTQYNA